MLTAKDVSYRFGRKVALVSISTEFESGATLLLGPNGAGKSTLLEVLASVRRPTTGTITLGDVTLPTRRDSALRAYRSRVAWLPQRPSTFPGLNVREHVAFAGWLKGLSKRAAWEKSAAALAAVDLAAKSAERVSALSGGQLRRLAIAGALVHDADVVLFDEPTANLDPAQRQRFRNHLADLAETRTVIVSSHDTDESTRLFERVVVLAGGRIRYSGGMSEFLRPAAQVPDDSQRLQAAYAHWVGDSES